MKVRVMAAVPVLIVVLLVAVRIFLRLNRPDPEPDAVPLFEADVAVQCAVYSADLQHYLTTFATPTAIEPTSAGEAWVGLLQQLAVAMDCESDPEFSMVYYCSVVATEPGEYASIDDVPAKVCRGEPPALDRADVAAENEAVKPDAAGEPAEASFAVPTGRGVIDGPYTNV